MNKKCLFLLPAVFVCTFLFAQKETFDIVTYTRPKGWIKDVHKEYRAFTKLDKTKGLYCKIIVYRSTPSTGNGASDFDALWKELVANPYKITEVPEKTEPQVQNGWEVRGGAGQFIFNNQPSVAMLTTLSSPGKMVGIVSLTNHEGSFPDIEKFITSVSVPPAKPASDIAKNPQPQPQLSSNPSGIHTAITNFTDGWSSTPEADWVRVTKGNITVLLHYGIPFDDVMRLDAIVECWKRICSSKYQVHQDFVFRPGTFDDRFNYMEADVTEKSSGRRMYVGFSVVSITGIAYCIEAQAPNRDAYKKEFPDYKRLEAMMNSNRFAVHASDIAGTWNSFGSSAISLYNVYTGGFAGMNMTAISDEFTFEKNGTYSSRHAGAASMAGNTQFFDNKYNGRITVNNWEVTLTNRYNGKTESFHAHYEAVKGGRILFLQNKQYSGIQYRLVKVK
jgi:hypothetical protein